MNRDFNLAALAHAYPRLESSGLIRSNAEDFVVDEQLGFTATGEGEHVLIRLRKKLINTEQVARELSRFASVPRKAVSYAGLKDRHAVTSQYFSVHLPGSDDPDWLLLSNDSLEILSARRHQKKLKRGALSKNLFRLLIRNFSGDKDATEQRLQAVLEGGVPNYFMSQRFGHAYNNLVTADRILTQGIRIRDRFKRNMYLSAARSWLFNLVLAKRIETGIWNRAVNGDSLMLDHSRACFHVDEVDGEIAERISNLEVHPTAPLWGKGKDMVTADALGIQNEVFQGWQAWLDGLVDCRQELARRGLRAAVPDLQWEWSGNDALQLRFSLPPGSYATAVLREILDFEDAARVNRGAGDL